MKVKSLIGFLEKHNEASIILTEKFEPEEIILLYAKENKDVLVKFKDYYKSKFPNLKFHYIEIKEDFNNVMKILEKYSDESNIFNLTTENTLLALIMYHFTVINKQKALYVNIKNEEILDFKDGKKVKLDTERLDIPIRDIIDSNGGEILVHSTEMANKKIVAYLANCIAKNLELWERLKYRLYDGDIFTHLTDDINKIHMNITYLNKEEKSIALKALNKLSDLKQISYKENKEGIYEVRFLNNYIKSFIFKSGSWLEVYTKNILDEIEGIDDIKSGLLFLWNEDVRRVKNELDVVAVKDARVICISCKDSARYDEVALNELHVYSNLLGGNNCIKILVCTKEPLKSSVKSRAVEMGIHIVCFNGDKDSFKKKIEKIIKA